MSVLPPVLVVDDEKNMRLSLMTLLGDEGYTVRAVERAEDGLQLLGRGEKFLMAITDACLDGMSGYDFLARARALERKRWRPAVQGKAEGKYGASRSPSGHYVLVHPGGGARGL